MPKKYSKVALSVAAIALLVHLSYGMIILDPPQNAGQYMDCPRLTWIDNEWTGNLVGELVPSTTLNSTGK